MLFILRTWIDISVLRFSWEVFAFRLGVAWAEDPGICGSLYPLMGCQAWGTVERFEERRPYFSANLIGNRESSAKVIIMGMVHKWCHISFKIFSYFKLFPKLFKKLNFHCDITYKSSPVINASSSRSFSQFIRTLKIEKNSNRNLDLLFHAEL